jgi:hypothetical protein
MPSTYKDAAMDGPIASAIQLMTIANSITLKINPCGTPFS